ncbi:MAG: LysR substrate-binding domain-containing protein [Kofleriaceae bacterium]|nr:LysR substrate-binding domain-containing protein [Kofleriaceae bacterium]
MSSRRASTWRSASPRSRIRPPPPSASARSAGWSAPLPRYLAARGTPRRPADLAKHELVGFSNTMAVEPWRFKGSGRAATVRAVPRLSVNTAEVAIAAALDGRGLTRVLSYMIVEELATKQVAIVLPKFEPAPLPVHVVVTEGRRAPTRVRAFVELAVERLRAVLR